MTTTKQATVPVEELGRLLYLNQLMLSVVEGIGEQDDKILITRLKDIISPKLRDSFSAVTEGFDSLIVAHLVHDLLNSTTEVAKYLPGFNSNAFVEELEVMQ